MPNNLNQASPARRNACSCCQTPKCSARSLAESCEVQIPSQLCPNKGGMQPSYQFASKCLREKEWKEKFVCQGAAICSENCNGLQFSTKRPVQAKQILLELPAPAGPLRQFGIPVLGRKGLRRLQHLLSPASYALLARCCLVGNQSR